MAEVQGITIPEFHFAIVTSPGDGGNRVEVGPQRLTLTNGDVFDTKGGAPPYEMYELPAGQWVKISNPYDAALGKCRTGEVEVRTGPLIFPLWPGEKLVNKSAKIVLEDQESASLECKEAFTGGDGKARRAGERYRVLGPCSFVPSPFEEVVETVRAIVLHAGQGIYVKNDMTSEIRLEQGPLAFLRDTNESLYEKRLPDAQASSLGLEVGRSSHEAIKLQLSPGELVCVVGLTGEERVFMGPQGLLLGPQDEVKVLRISAGKPKGTSFVDVSKIFTGPDFMSDKIVCSTSDNMEIEMLVTYKWELLVDPATAVDLFQTEDFVGVACRKLQAKIREAAAMHTFADFKVDTVRHLQEAIFSTGNSLPSGQCPRDGPCLYLEDIRFLVTEVDVKGLEPVDQGLKKQFTQELQNRMQLLVARMEQEAEVELARFKQTKELELLEGRRALLNAAKADQTKEETLGKSKVDQELELELAKAEGDADAKVKAKARELESFKMARIMELLSGPGGETFLELEKARAIGAVDQSWVVPTKSALQLPGV